MTARSTKHATFTIERTFAAAPARVFGAYLHGRVTLGTRSFMQVLSRAHPGEGEDDRKMHG